MVEGIPNKVISRNQGVDEGNKINHERGHFSNSHTYVYKLNGSARLKKICTIFLSEYKLR